MIVVVIGDTDCRGSELTTVGLTNSQLVIGTN